MCMTLTFFYLLSSFCVRNKDYKLLSLKFLIKESYWEKKNVIDSKMLLVSMCLFLCQQNLLLLQNIFIISPQIQKGTGTRGQGLTLHHNIGLTFEFENTCS